MTMQIASVEFIGIGIVDLSNNAIQQGLPIFIDIAGVQAQITSADLNRLDIEGVVIFFFQPNSPTKIMST